MKKLNISQVDTIFANGSYPIEFLLFYRNKLDTKKIRYVLKKLSADFWPIFGEYDSGLIHFNGYLESDCFDEEIKNENFESDLSYGKFYKKYYQAVPQDLKKLFYLKIIQYKNGTVIIPKMNHLAGDGYSYFYFLSVLAQIAQNKFIPFKNCIIRSLAKPNHHRTIVKEFQLPDIEFNTFKAESNVTIEDEYITKTDVKEKIREVAENLHSKISTNDILSAMVIKKLIEIQENNIGASYIFNMPIDVRRNIKEYGPKFFGNGLMFNQIKFKTDEILKSEIEEIAIQIRQGMPEVTAESYKNYLIGLENIIAEKQTDLLRPYNPETGCLVTNLSRLPANRLNFGSGNPEMIFPLTVGKNAASILSDDEHFILRLVF
ncbi:MAG: hypothetical protein JW956_14540 [Calditrichaceae bacterium]|nr:hypothetical protein [Calditrichaceae bacterium]